MKQEQINDIRDFNRFYAKVIGLLDKTYLNSHYSLAEVRVLNEIFHHSDITANDILTILGLDKGYLSRILKTFEKKKMVIKKRSNTDGRAMNLALTDSGKTEFLTLDAAVIAQVNQAFSNLSDEDYDTLIKSMKTIKSILKNR
jgi:DNA-binding MarR family transcriptional regulator